MRVLITGKNGFIGQCLASSLTEFELTAVGRTDLNLCDRTQVNQFFEQQDVFDVVIHTAISGGRRNYETVDGPDVIQNNLLMFFNLLSNKHKFKKLIQLGSGAEFDRFTGKNINELSKIHSSYPIDAYGMSKNIISRICDTENDCYTFYIYNIFGPNELPTRMISGNIIKYINKQDLVVYKNKIMDFFSMEDFVKLCKFYIANENLPKTVQCCYSNKTTLLDIANMINNLGEYKVNIKISSSNLGPSYYGDSTLIDRLPLKFTGLDYGLSNLYNYILSNFTNTYI
jgi:UDP-glucose 4-epimerase